MTLEQQLLQYHPCCAQEEADREQMLRFLREDPENILTRKNTEAHFTSSAWIVTPERDKILMVYHNIYDSWSWTGGHADGEQDLLAVALREVTEETGLTNIRPVREEIWSLETLQVASHRKRGEIIPSHLHLNVTYLIEATEDEPLRVKPDENSAVRWFPAQEAVSRSSEPEMRIVYQKLMNKLRG